MKFRSLKGLATATVAATVLLLIADVADQIAPRPSMTVLMDPKASGGELAFALVGAALSFSWVLAFGAWSWRAAANVRALGKKRLAFTPLTTIAWWFIPVANFYMPYRALREAWLATGDDKPRALFAWWIGFWLSFLAGLIGEATHSTAVEVLGSLIEAASVFFFARAAFGMAARQDRAATTAKRDL